MARLTNDFSWSVSRDALFRSCKRAYYYTYYGSWGGWESDAPERVRKLYILKNIKTLPMWGGTIVHDTIAAALERYSRTGEAIAARELQARARRQLRSGWVEAVNGAWRARPKKTNLHELYYGNGKSLPSEMTEGLKSRVYNCLAAFADSGVLRAVLDTPYMNWKPVDSLESFMIEDVKVWCAIDFAYTDASGLLHIVDWKTGSEDREALATQLVSYALFACERWLAPFDRIRCHGVFLRDKARVSDYPVQPEQVVRTKDLILTSSEDMRKMLDDPATNLASEEAFPCCENEGVCRRCNFRELCPYIDGDGRL